MLTGYWPWFLEMVAHYRRNGTRPNQPTIEYFNDMFEYVLQQGV